MRVAHAGLVAGLRMEDQVGTQAARLLLDNLKDSMTVALSWGHALQSMVYATTADHEFHRISLVQLVGGLSSISNEISGQELVRELAVRLNAEYRFLHAPATLESAGSRDALLAEPSIAGSAGRGAAAPTWRSSGSAPRRTARRPRSSPRSTCPAKERKAFWAAEPVGDIAARYYDAAGHPIHGAVDERILGIALEDLISIPHVVGVAHGRAKAPGVLGAIRGHLIDSLVCDETLARSLLSDARTAGANRR